MSVDRTQQTVPTALWRVRVSLASRSLRENWSLFLGTRIGIVGLVIIGLYALLAAAHPVLMSTVWEPRIYDPVVGYAFGETRQPAPPSLSHPLGTDPLGRDILSQLMFSARSEFLLGLLAATVTVTIGTVVGAVSAYFGGLVDTILMRLADIMIMMPAISVLIVLSALIGVEHLELALIIGILSGFGGTGVVLKSQALSVVVKPYIEAARTAGRRTFSHHTDARRAESASSVVPVHDVHRDQRDILRSGAELPRASERSNELGADDPHHRIGRIPASGRGVLVADIPGQSVDNAALFFLLPCRTVAR